MKMIVAGSRSLKSKHHVSDAVMACPWKWHRIDEIVHGGAKGVDDSAQAWANIYDIPTTVFEPDWDEHGDAAGPIRNEQMAEYGDCLVAVWDGESSGTRSMIRKAADAALPIFVHVVNTRTVVEGDDG